MPGSTHVVALTAAALRKLRLLDFRPGMFISNFMKFTLGSCKVLSFKTVGPMIRDRGRLWKPFLERAADSLTRSLSAPVAKSNRLVRIGDRTVEEWRVLIEGKQ
jgi:hypothetical protein